MMVLKVEIPVHTGGTKSGNTEMLHHIERGSGCSTILKSDVLSSVCMLSVLKVELLSHNVDVSLY